MTFSELELLEEWKTYMGGDPINEKMFQTQLGTSGFKVKRDLPTARKFIESLCNIANTFCDPESAAKLKRRLNRRINNYSVSIPVKQEQDVVICRQAGADMAVFIGFGSTDKVKIATAISELARNIYYYAGTGEITLSIICDMKNGIQVISRDEGPGIEDVSLVMSNQYVSQRGMGMGLKGVQKLVDFFDLKSTVGQGTTVTFMKYMR